MTPATDSSQGRGPIAWMAGNAVAANLLMLLFVLGGFFFFLQSTSEVFPEFNLDRVSVIVPYPGASPEEVEQGIVLALEDAVYGVEGVGEVNAQASESLARLTAEVLDSDEVMRVAQDIKNAVDRIVSFPNEAEKPVVSIDKRQRIVLTLAVFGNSDDAVIREAAEQLMDAFVQNPEIGPVELSGVRDYEIHIEVAQANLRRLGLTLNQIADRVRATALESPGGVLKTDGGDLMVRLQERRDKAREFADIPIVAGEDGSQVVLGDIAEIKDGFEDSSRYARFNGQNAVMLDVYRVGKQTPVGISKAVQAEISQLNKQFPDGLQFEVVSDRSKIFSQRAELLVKNGLWGLILIIVFLALFLDLRLAFWVSMGIPISFAGAFLLFPFTDFTINMVTMFAFIVSLGIVVDDAIVVGESVYSFREQGYSPLEASIRGAQEVALPITFSILTNIAAFLPFFFVEGFMGKIFSTIPVVVVSVFIISLFEALFILPEHLHLKARGEAKSHFFRGLKQFQVSFNQRFHGFVNLVYRQWIGRCIEHRYAVLIIACSVLIVVLAYVSSGRMGLILFPRTESDTAFAELKFAPGVPVDTLKQAEQALMQAAQRVIEENGGEQLSKIFYSVVSEDTVWGNVRLTDPEVRPISTRRFANVWRERLGPIPAAESVTFMSNRGGPGSGANLTVELSHRDIDRLELAGYDLGQTLAEFPNVNDINDGAAKGKRQFDFTINALGTALGLTAVEVAGQTRAAFQGIEVIKQQRGRNEVTVRLRLPEAERASQYDFENLILRTASGQEVPLRDVVDMREGRSYTTIRRHEGRRILTVNAMVEPPEQSNQVVNALKSTVLPELQQQYPGLGFSFAGHQKDMRDSLKSLFHGLIAILILIFGLLAMLFRSYMQPLIVMSVIPFSVIGVVAGHLIMGFSLSVMSMFGFIALVGVVVNDSLILIEFANRKRRAGEKIEDAIQKAAMQRFRPVLLTTLTTFVGLAPMILETSRQARFLVPMAVSLGFGIIFATLVTLVLVPVFYIIVRDIKELVIYLPGFIARQV